MTLPRNPFAYPWKEDHPLFDETLHHPGMKLRDWFAGQALAGGADPRSAYAMADLMLELRDDLA